MKQSHLENSVSCDLEQQLFNVLEFVTDAPKTDVIPPSESENALAKGLYYLKEQNFPLAAKWMRLAAMSGDLKGQFYLGLLFVKGQGVPPSPFHAVAWLTLAQSQGHEGASQVLDDVRKYLSTKRFKDAQCYAATLYEQVHNIQYLTKF